MFLTPPPLKVPSSRTYKKQLRVVDTYMCHLWGKNSNLDKVRGVYNPARTPTVCLQGVWAAKKRHLFYISSHKQTNKTPTQSDEIYSPDL